jgi:hypothetical protein
VTPVRQLDILRRLQRVLEEGGFVATYKLALLQALADLSVEHGPAREGTLQLPLNEIAAKFIAYYWRQTAPFSGQDGSAEGSILKQDTGRQATIVNSIVAARSRSGGNLAAYQRDSNAWPRLVARVARTVEAMPLWKLQSVGQEIDEFLYRRADFANGCILLLPGVADTLRSFHGLITHLIRGSWVGQVRRIGGNRDLLGESADLYSFLFGTGRQNLDGYRGVLREFQSARCFYCLKEVRDEGAADHFIPWARYPIDLGHNFVFAHTTCNGSKSDYLAHPDHLVHWREQNLDRADELADVLRDAGLSNDASRSQFIARWAYEQGENAGAHVWLRRGALTRLDGSWRRAMTPLLAVAEAGANYQIS